MPDVPVNYAVVLVTNTKPNFNTGVMGGKIFTLCAFTKYNFSAYEIVAALASKNPGKTYAYMDADGQTYRETTVQSELPETDVVEAAPDSDPATGIPYGEIT
jgi:hypothetical protein